MELTGALTLPGGAVILAAGFVMGAVNNLAGGGGALGLLAFEEACRLPAAMANASLRPAAMFVAVGGALGFRSRAARAPRGAWLQAALSLPGAIAGSFLVVTMPVWAYRATLVTILALVLWQQLQPASRRPARGDGIARPVPAWLQFALYTLVGVHLGFVQVGAGLITMAVMHALHERDLVRINASKMVVVMLSSTVSVAVLAWQAQVVWGPALLLGAGAGVGSFLASRWSVWKGHAGVRGAVLVISTVVLSHQLYKLSAGV
jgi:uncharacterized membrane protein YfcA